MRLLLVACFAVLALTVQSAPNKHDLLPNLIKHTFSSREDISEIIKRGMEKFRDLMINGDESLGLPTMDPYVMDHREIDLNLEIMTGTATADNLSIAGTSKFNLTSASGNDDPLHAEFDLTIPKVDCYADHYVLDAVIAKNYKIFGDGILRMVAKDMRLVGKANGTIDAAEHLEVTNLDLFITVQIMESDMTGLMNSDEECELANEIISEFGPGILEDYGGQLGFYFGDIIRQIINAKIKDLTVDEIIDMIMS